MTWFEKLKKKLTDAAAKEAAKNPNNYLKQSKLNPTVKKAVEKGTTTIAKKQANKPSSTSTVTKAKPGKTNSPATSYTVKPGLAPNAVRPAISIAEAKAQAPKVETPKYIQNAQKKVDSFTDKIFNPTNEEQKKRLAKRMIANSNDKKLSRVVPKSSIAKWYEEHTTEASRANPYIDPFTNQCNEPLKELFIMLTDEDAPNHNLENVALSLLNVFYRPYYANKQAQDNYVSQILQEENVYKNVIESSKYFYGDSAKINKILREHNLITTHQNRNQVKFNIWDEENKILYVSTMNYNKDRKTLDFNSLNTTIQQNPSILPKSVIAYKDVAKKDETSGKDVFYAKLIENAATLRDPNKLTAAQKEDILNQRDQFYDIDVEQFLKNLKELSTVDTSNIKVDSFKNTPQNLQTAASSLIAHPGTATILNLLTSSGLTLDRLGSAVRAMNYEVAKANNSITQAYLPYSPKAFGENDTRPAATVKLTEVAKALKEGFTYTYDVPKFTSRSEYLRTGKMFKTKGSGEKYQDTSYMTFFNNLPEWYPDNVLKKHPNWSGFIADLLTDPTFFMQIGAGAMASGASRGLGRDLREVLSSDAIQKILATTGQTIDNEAINKLSKRITKQLKRTDISELAKRLEVINELKTFGLSDDLASTFITTYNTSKNKVNLKIADKINETTINLTGSYDAMKWLQKTHRATQKLDDLFTKAVFIPTGVYPALKITKETYKAGKKLTQRNTLRLTQELSLSDLQRDTIRNAVRNTRAQYKLREISIDPANNMSRVYIESKRIINEAAEIEGRILTHEESTLTPFNTAVQKFENSLGKTKEIAFGLTEDANFISNNYLELISLNTPYQNLRTLDDLREALHKDITLFNEQISEELSKKEVLNNLHDAVDVVCDTIELRVKKQVYDYLDKLLKELEPVDKAPKYFAVTTKNIDDLTDILVKCEDLLQEHELQELLENLLSKKQVYVTKLDEALDLIRANKVINTHIILADGTILMSIDNFKKLGRHINNMYRVIDANEDTLTKLYDKLTKHFDTGELSKYNKITTEEVNTLVHFAQNVTETTAKYADYVTSFENASNTLIQYFKNINSEDVLIQDTVNGIKPALNGLTPEQYINSQQGIQRLIELYGSEEAAANYILDTLTGFRAPTIFKDDLFGDIIYLPRDVRDAINEHLRIQNDTRLVVNMYDKVYTEHLNYAVQHKMITERLSDIIDSFATGVGTSDTLINFLSMLNESGIDITRIQQKAKALQLTQKFNDLVDECVLSKQKSIILKDIIYDFTQNSVIDIKTNQYIQNAIKQKLKDQLVMKYNKIESMDSFRRSLMPSGKYYNTLREAGISDEAIHEICMGGHGAGEDARLTMLRTRLFQPAKASEWDDLAINQGYAVRFYDTETISQGTATTICEQGAAIWRPIDNFDYSSVTKFEEYSADQLKTIFEHIRNSETISVKQQFTEEQILKGGMHPPVEYCNQKYGSVENWMRSGYLSDKPKSNAENMKAFYEAISISDEQLASNKVIMVGYNNFEYDDQLMKHHPGVSSWFKKCQTEDVYHLFKESDALVWSEEELDKCMHILDGYFNDLIDANIENLMDINPTSFLHDYKEMLYDMNRIERLANQPGSITEELRRVYENLYEDLTLINTNKLKEGKYVKVPDYHSVKFKDTKQVFLNKLYQLYYPEAERDLTAILNDPSGVLNQVFKRWSDLDELSLVNPMFEQLYGVKRLADIDFRSAEEATKVLLELEDTVGGQTTNIMRILNPFEDGSAADFQYAGVRRKSTPLMYDLYPAAFNDSISERLYKDLFNTANKIDKIRMHSGLSMTYLSDLIEQDVSFLDNCYQKLTVTLEGFTEMAFADQDIATKSAIIQYLLTTKYRERIFDIFWNLRRIETNVESGALISRPNISTMSRNELKQIVDVIFTKEDAFTKDYFSELIYQSYVARVRDTLSLGEQLGTAYNINKCIDKCLQDFDTFSYCETELGHIVGADAVPMRYQAVAIRPLHEFYIHYKQLPQIEQAQFINQYATAANRINNVKTQNMLARLKVSTDPVAVNNYLKEILTDDSHPGIMFIKYKDSMGRPTEEYALLRDKLSLANELFVYDDDLTGQFIVALKKNDATIADFRKAHFRDINNSQYRVSTDDINNILEETILDPTIRKQLQRAYGSMDFLASNIYGDVTNGLVTVHEFEKWIQSYLPNDYLKQLDIQVPDKAAYMAFDCAYTMTDSNIILPGMRNGANALQDLEKTIRTLSKTNVDRTNSMLYYLQGNDLLGLNHLIDECGFAKEDILKMLNANTDLVPCSLIEDTANIAHLQKLEATLERLKSDPNASVKRIQQVEKEIYNISTVKVQRLDIDNIKDLEFALQHKVSLVPVQVYETTFSDLNYFTSGPLVKVMQKYMSIMKGSYLATAGTAFRNYVDETLKTFNDVGWDNAPVVLKNQWQALHDFKDYQKMIRKCIKHSQNPHVTNGWLSDNFRYMCLADPEFAELAKRLPRDRFLDMNTFINYGASGGGLATVTRKQAFLNETGHLDLNDLLHSKGDLKLQDISAIGKYLGDAAISAPFIPLQWGEQLTRYAHHLTLKDMGIAGTSAFNKVSSTHFNYALKDRATVYAELVIPFYNYMKLNAEYWCTEIVNKPRYLHNLVRYEYAQLRPEMIDVDEDIKTGDYVHTFALNQIANGNLNIKIPGISNIDSQDVFLKLNPSIMDFLHLFMDTPNTLLRSLFSPLQMGLNETEVFESMIEQGLYEAPYATNGYHSLIPYYGTLWEPLNAQVDNIINKTFTAEEETYYHTFLGLLLRTPGIAQQVPGLFAFESLDYTATDIANLYAANGYEYDYVQRKMVKKSADNINSADKMREYCEQNHIDYDLVSKSWVPYGMGSYTASGDWSLRRYYTYMYTEKGLVHDFVSGQWVPKDTVGAITNYYDYNQYMREQGYEQEYYTRDHKPVWVKAGTAVAHSWDEAAELYRTQGKAWDYILEKYVPADLARDWDDAVEYWESRGLVYDRARKMFVKKGAALAETWDEYTAYQNAMGLEYDIVRKEWVRKGTALKTYQQHYQQHGKWFDTFEEMAAYKRKQGLEWDPIKKKWVKIGNAPSWDEYSIYKKKQGYEWDTINKKWVKLGEGPTWDEMVAYKKAQGLGWDSIHKKWVPLNQVPTWNEYQTYMESKGLEWDYITKSWVTKGTAQGKTWKDYRNYSTLHNQTYNYSTRRWEGNYTPAKYNKKAAAKVFHAKADYNYTTQRNSYIYNVIHNYINRTMPDAYTRIDTNPMPLNLLQVYPTRYRYLRSRNNAAKYLSNPYSYKKYYKT